ncbi:acyltransferase family protein [Mucilaginibacter sp. HD30]
MNSLTSPVYNKNLEGLRGICALVVFIAHFFGFSFFGIEKNTVVDIIIHTQFAQVAVLIFFIISGYVMGINHIYTPFNVQNVKTYLMKRIVRLYPIYVVALLICVVFGYRSLYATQVIGHVFFLQEVLVETLSSNTPLWSLSFEFIYYLLFIIVWAFNGRSKNLYIYICLIILICALFIGHNNNAIRSLFIGWVFWLAGLYLARLQKKSVNSKSMPFISYILIILATYRLQSGGFYLRLMHLDFAGIEHIMPADLVFIPVCLLLMLNITGRDFKYELWLKIAAIVIPALNIACLVYFKHDIRQNNDWMYGTVFFCLSMLLMWLKTNYRYFETLAPVGKISFAVYVLHFPICYFLNIGLSQIYSGPTLLITGFIMAIGATFGLSYVAEIIVQPRIRNLFFNKRQVTA